MKILTTKTPTRAALIGLAIGDALGVPVEFRSRVELKKNPVSDMRAYGTLSLSEYDNGVELKFMLDEPEQENLAILYFKQYLEFISEKQSELKVDFEKSISEKEKELFILSLKNEIQQLKFKLELKEMKIAFLSHNISNFVKKLQNDVDQVLNINLPRPSTEVIDATYQSSNKQLCEDFRKIRRLISNNELKSALKHFYDICESQLNDFINDATNYSKRYSDLLSKDNLGLLKLDDKIRIENQVINAFLNTLDQIEKKYCH